MPRPSWSGQIAASAKVMFPGRISSIRLCASAVRFASAIKPTIRWPLSYQAKDGVNVSRLNSKNTEAKVAVKGSGESSIRKCFTLTTSCCREPKHQAHRPENRAFNRYDDHPQTACTPVSLIGDSEISNRPCESISGNPRAVESWRDAVRDSDSSGSFTGDGLQRAE